MKVFKTLFFVIFLGITSACSFISPYNIESITLNKESLTLRVDQSFQLVPTIKPDQAKSRPVVWSCNNSHVSYENGLITALSAGQCTVYCKSANDKSISAKCSIKVLEKGVQATSVKIDDHASSCYVGETLSLTSTVLPENTLIKDVTWTTSDPSLATIDKDGVMTALKYGDVTVTATTTDGTKLSDSCSIHIKKTIKVSSIEICKDSVAIESLTIDDEDPITLTTKILPTNATNKQIVWSSGDTNIVSVSEGTLTAISKGSTTITAKNTFSGVSETIDVEVTFEPEKTIYLPSTYYGSYYSDDFSWTNGADLKQKLSNLMQTKRTAILNYGAKGTNWATNTEADHTEYDFEMLDVVYSSIDVAASKTNTGWQREHVWPASLMTGLLTGDAVDSDKYKDRANDFQNLLAVSRSENVSRSNKNLGNVTTPTGHIGDCQYDTLNFEPNDKDKGREARALFYMDTMNGYVSVEPLHLQEDYVHFKSGDPNPAAHGNVSDLVDWANTFAVDRLEAQHNQCVATSSISGSCQGNRNCYVDYPQLVEYVYGDKQDEAGELKFLVPSLYSLDMTSGDEYYNFAIKKATRTFAVGSSFNVANDLTLVNVMKNNTNSTVAFNTGYFTISGLSNGYTFKSTDSGKSFEIVINKSSTNPYNYSKSSLEISYTITVA